MSKFVGISLSQVNELVDGIRIRLAKESALIAVDEIIEELKEFDTWDGYAFARISFWNDVKAELETFN